MSINDSLAFAVLEDANVFVTESGIELSTALDEISQGNGFVGCRLVNDRGLLDRLVDGDRGVDGVVLMRIALDDGLHDVVNVVVMRLGHFLALVDNLLLVDAPDDLVVVLVQAGKESAVFVRVDVLLANVGLGDKVGLVNGFTVTLVEDRLNVVLNVMVVFVDELLADNLLDFVVVDALPDDGCEMLVIMGSIGIGLRVQLGVVLMRGICGGSRRVRLSSVDAGIDRVTTRSRARVA